MDAFTCDKWILLAAFLLEFNKDIWESFITDLTLQTYMLISPPVCAFFPDSQTV